jgi:hypothetical protein
MAGILAARAETVTAEPDALLEYIEATGTQYIDTGVNAETGLKARLDFTLESFTGSSDWGVLGAATVSGDSNNRRRIFLCHLLSNKPFFGYGLGARGNPANSFNFVSGKRYELVTDVSDTNSISVVQNGRSTLSAANVETYKAKGNVNLNLNLFIFATNYGGEPYWNSKGKLYELKIFKKNGENDGANTFDLIRHYLPCIKNGRAGLYDKVNGTISYSYGSAEFVAGPVVDKPLDYVKWVWTNGNQWFDTWVWGKSGLRSEVDVSVREYSGDHCILGTRRGDNRYYPAYSYEGAFRYAYGAMPSKANTTSVLPTNDVTFYMDTRYLIKSDLRDGYQSVTVSKNGGTPVELHKDGQAYSTGENVVTNTLALMACRNGEGYYMYQSKALLYATKIWDGDELLRDFVPVVATNAEGVAYAGLYDRVSERIFRQIGTAEFDLASQVGGVTNSLRAVERPTTRIEYVDSDALLDYVDLGIIGKDGVEMEAEMAWLYVPVDGAFVGARTNTQQDHGGNTGVRFYPYHYWKNAEAGSRHRLCYDGDLFVIGSQSATANTKYRIVTRLDVGRGDASLSTFADGAWGAPETRVILPENGYDSPVDTGLPLYLFAINLDSVPRYLGKVRLYKLKLREKQQDGSYALVRDLVPVLDPATGAPVLWDKVTETYFRNNGKYLLAGGGTERPFAQGIIISIK